VLVSLTQRDAVSVGNDFVEGDAALSAFAEALRAAGLDVRCREATPADVEELGSSWAKRLGIRYRRAAHILVGRKPQTTRKPQTMRNTG
jgi:hypothetical protein